MNRNHPDYPSILRTDDDARGLVRERDLAAALGIGEEFDAEALALAQRGEPVDGRGDARVEIPAGPPAAPPSGGGGGRRQSPRR